MTSLRGRLRRRQVKAARALLGWSQAELAKRAGVCHAAVANYECGNSYLRRPEAVVAALERAGARLTARGVELVEPYSRPTGEDHGWRRAATG